MIRNKKQFILGLLVTLIGVLLLTNPLERHFFDRIASDYSGIHGGMKMNTAELEQLGESEKSNYLLFSTFTYRFGTIGVEYFGVAGYIFYSGSYVVDDQKNSTRSI